MSSEAASARGRPRETAMARAGLWGAMALALAMAGAHLSDPATIDPALPSLPCASPPLQRGPTVPHVTAEVRLPISVSVGPLPDPCNVGVKATGRGCGCVGTSLR